MVAPCFHRRKGKGNLIGLRFLPNYWGVISRCARSSSLTHQVLHPACTLRGARELITNIPQPGRHLGRSLGGGPGGPGGGVPRGGGGGEWRGGRGGDRRSGGGEGNGFWNNEKKKEVVSSLSKQFWMAGEDESCGNNSDMVIPPGGMDHLRVHPPFLHSNTLRHEWALGAFAELLDNPL
nr:protein microrchidia 7-like [Tanacetum cinerariifolium]